MHHFYIYLIVTLLFTLNHHIYGQGYKKVEKWGVFEDSVIYHYKNVDPFRDVTIDVVYTKPDGTTTESWAFYDGDKVWKFRFMPDQTGDWQYRVILVDGTVLKTGMFKCGKSDNPGMLTIYKPNPFWFGFSGGKPLLIRSLHVGDRFFANENNTLTGEKWNPQLREKFLDWVEKQGYNMLSIASHYLNRSTPGRGEGWDTPDLWDAEKQQPNPFEFERMEMVINELANRKIMIYPFGGFFGRDSDFPRNPGYQEVYVKYVMSRLGAYWNILLNVGGPEPRMKHSPYMEIDEVNQLGQLIQKYNIFDHPLSVHNKTGDDEFVHQPYVTFGTLQGPKGKTNIDLTRIYNGLMKNHHPGKPVYAQETLWPGNKWHREINTLDDIRRKAIVMHMAAATINFGDMNGNSSSGFSGKMYLNKRHQAWHDEIKKVWDFFGCVQVYEMVPAPELVDTGFCLARNNEAYLVYLPDGKPVSVDIPSKKFRITWIDAVTLKPAGKPCSVSDGKGLNPPGVGEWLLLLEKELL